ncbi:MAG: recombinase family protein, partial [Oceanicaulis sp.]
MKDYHDELTQTEAAAKPKAFSYLRFSRPEQSQGDSFRRQMALAEGYADKHGLELDRELTFHDLGVSAFRGANAEKGALGQFIEAIDRGLVPRGSYLLVENLDRLSRETPFDASETLREVVNRGIILVTLSDE